MNKSGSYIYEFGEFRLDLVKRELRREGKIVAMTPKVFDTLSVLVQNQGQIVTKDLLMEEIWGDSFVEESGLMRNISILRKTLGEQNQAVPFIATVPGQGYRFLANVREILDENEDGLTVHERTRAKIIIEEKDEPQFRSLAVLPFKTIGNTEENQYLALGMADALITKLSSLQQLRVRPTSAVIKYGGLEQNPIKAGRELRVESVIEGSVWQINERLRITAQMVNVKNEVTIWADKFDESFTDIFAIQDSISERIASALEFQLTTRERKLLSKHETENLNAYKLYIRGFYELNLFTPQSTYQAITCLEEAIVVDPNYAIAYVILFGCYLLLAIYNVLPTEIAAAKARQLATKALELDETLPAAHYAQGYVNLFFDWKFESAEREFRRAVELNPNDAQARRHYSVYLCHIKRFEDGIAEAKFAVELDPLTVHINTHLAHVFYYAKHYDEAIASYHNCLEIEPKNSSALIGLCLSYAAKGMLTEALTIAARTPEFTSKVPSFVAIRSFLYALAGETEAAHVSITELLELSKQQFVSAYDIATIYAGLDDIEQAFVWLNKAFEERALWLIYLSVDPRLDSLRGDPRFDDLLKRVGFEAN